MEPILTIQYTPEKRDYVRASRVLARKSPWFLFVAVILLLAMIGSAVILIVPSVGSNTLERFAPIVLLVSLVYALYFLFLIPLQLGRAFKSNEHLRMTRTLTFLDSHLHMQIGEQSVDLRWDALQRVIDGGEYFLLIFQGDEQVYPFIPTRAIADIYTKNSLFAFFRAKSIPVI